MAAAVLSLLWLPGLILLGNIAINEEGQLADRLGIIAMFLIGLLLFASGSYWAWRILRRLWYITGVELTRGGVRILDRDATRRWECLRWDDVTDVRTAAPIVWTFLWPRVAFLETARGAELGPAPGFMRPKEPGPRDLLAQFTMRFDVTPLGEFETNYDGVRMPWGLSGGPSANARLLQLLIADIRAQPVSHRSS